jgi:hypothetical protein
MRTETLATKHPSFAFSNANDGCLVTSSMTNIITSYIGDR